MIVFLDTYAVTHRHRLDAGEYGRSRIPLLIGIVPIGIISVKRQINLPFLQLGFLNAEKIGIQLLEYILESLAATGTKPVDIP